MVKITSGKTANSNKIEERRTKILETKLLNPTMGQDEIAETVNTSQSTVQRDLQYLNKDGSLKDCQVMNAIKDADINIVKLVQLEIERRFNEGEISVVPMRELSSTAKDSQVRYSFLAGKNADDNGGEKNIGALLDKMING